MQRNFFLEVQARRMAFRATTQRTRLVYAAPVHTLSLIIAALAWPRIQSAYRAIDLILARCRNGTLAVATPASRLPKVPAETWNTIKRYIALELFTEEQAFFLCNLHAKSRGASQSTPPRACHDCELQVQKEGMAKVFSKHHEKVTDMLSALGLEVASRFLVPKATFAFYRIDNNLDCMSLVALSEPLPKPNTIMFGHVTPAEPEVIAAAEVASGADARFARLFALMPVRKHEVDSNPPGKDEAMLAAMREALSAIGNTSDVKDPGEDGIPEATKTPVWKTLKLAREH